MQIANYKANGELITSAGSGGGAPTDATYITQTANGSLSAEQALASLSTGLMKVTTTTGVVSSVTDSAGLAGCISDETGSGALVFGTAPTLGAPVIADFTSAQHDHQDADDGGGLDAAAIQAGTLVLARGGTGVSAASNTALFNTIDPLTTKGDIITHDGTNTVRQAIGGTNGHVATVNSSATNGWEWAAASGSGAMTQLVAWTELGSDQASVSLSSISGSCKHLFLTIRIRTDHSASDDALVRFNADTTAGNYYGVFAYVTQTTTGAISNAGSVATITPIGGWVSANTATASYYTDYFIWIMDYTSTSRFKIFNMLSLVPITTTNFNHVTGGGQWLNSANAITAISIAPRNGSNLKAGTGYGLWGIV